MPIPCSNTEHHCTISEQYKYQAVVLRNYAIGLTSSLAMRMT